MSKNVWIVTTESLFTTTSSKGTISDASAGVTPWKNRFSWRKLAKGKKVKCLFYINRRDFSYRGSTRSEDLLLEISRRLTGPVLEVADEMVGGLETASVPHMDDVQTAVGQKSFGFFNPQFVQVRHET